MGCISNPRVGEYQQIEMGEYSLIRQTKIAEGAYGDIWKCQSCFSDSIFALKEIRLQNKQLDDMFKKQIHILEKLTKHKVKGSVALKTWSIQNGDPKTAYKIGRLLFQLGTITLLDQLSSKHFTDKQIFLILKDISQSLLQIHQLGIYHLDLKPQNIILIDNEYKLCDFGSAIESPVDYDKLDKKQKNNFVQYIEASSTLSYRSPEMIESNGKIIGAASDIWMLGCIAYLITFRRHPFQNQGQLAIISGNVKYPKESALTSLIKQMLCLSSNSRPSAKAIIDKIDILLKN